MSFAYCYLGLSQQCRACCYPLLSLLIELLWISQANLRLLSILHATNRTSQSLQAPHLDRDSCKFFPSSAFIRVWLLLEALSEPMARTPHGFTECCFQERRRTWGFYYHLCMNQHCQNPDIHDEPPDFHCARKLWMELLHGREWWMKPLNTFYFSLSFWVF